MRSRTNFLHTRSRVVGNLYVDDRRRMPFVAPYKTEMESFDFDETLSREVVLSRSRELARDCATALFKRFGWTPTDAVMKEIQEELR